MRTTRLRVNNAFECTLIPEEGSEAISTFCYGVLRFYLAMHLLWLVLLDTAKFLAPIVKVSETHR